MPAARAVPPVSDNASDNWAVLLVVMSAPLASTSAIRPAWSKPNPIMESESTNFSAAAPALICSDVASASTEGNAPTASLADRPAAANVSMPLAASVPEMPNFAPISRTA